MDQSAVKYHDWSRRHQYFDNFGLVRLPIFWPAMAAGYYLGGTVAFGKVVQGPNGADPKAGTGFVNREAGDTVVVMKGLRCFARVDQDG